jgi:hypothetical protein
VLFIDLRDYGDQTVEPAQALDALLRALRVRAEDIPPGAEQQAGLYRSVLAQATGPVLMVADNASPLALQITAAVGRRALGGVSAVAAAGL